MTYIFVRKRQTIAPPSSEWTPANLASSPRVWLDAEAGVYDAETGGSLITVGGTAVRRWEDQGGILDKSLTVSATNEARAPTWEASVLNGKPVLRFRDETYGSPVGCALYASNTNIYGDDPGRLAFFVVAKRNNQHTGSTAYGSGNLIGVGNYEPSMGIPSASSTTQGRNPTGYYSFSGVVSYHGEYATGWNAQPLIAPGTWFIYANFGHWDVATDGFYQTLRVNGGAYSTTSATKTPTAAIGTGARHLTIGGRYTPVTDVWDGDIAEVIYCSGQDWASSTSDRDKIEGYLAHKWGLTGALPSDHPYKSAAPSA
jgi:hypothetical protein